MYDEFLDRASYNNTEFLHVFITRKIVTEFLKRTQSTPEVSSIMEIGPGTGRGADCCRELEFQSYIGVEPNSRLADYCRKKGHAVLEEHLPNLSVPSSSFDLLFSIHVLEHAPTYLNAIDWCKEMMRVVRPGGYILVVAPNIMEFKNYFWNGDWSHGFPTTPNRIVQVFNDLGGKVIYSGNFHLGSSSWYIGVLSKLVSRFFPTTIVDLFSNKFFGRPLGTGLQQGALLGLAYVIIEKQ